MCVCGGGEQKGLVLRSYTLSFLEELGKTMKTLSLQSPGKRLNADTFQMRSVSVDHFLATFGVRPFYSNG